MKPDRDEDFAAVVDASMQDREDNGDDHRERTDQATRQPMPKTRLLHCKSGW